MKSCLSIVSKYICDDCKPKPAVKASKSSSQTSISQYFTTIRPLNRSGGEPFNPKVAPRHQKAQKSAAQQKADKLKKNAEKARKQREKRAEQRAKAEAAKHKNTFIK